MTLITFILSFSAVKQVPKLCSQQGHPGCWGCHCTWISSFLGAFSNASLLTAQCQFWELCGQVLNHSFFPMPWVLSWESPKNPFFHIDINAADVKEPNPAWQSTQNSLYLDSIQSQVCWVLLSHFTGLLDTLREKIKLKGMFEDRNKTRQKVQINPWGVADVAGKESCKVAGYG